MRILVASDIFLSKYITEKDNFFLELIGIIAANRPDIEFLFLQNKNLPVQSETNKWRTVPVGGMFGQKVLQRFWRKRRLPALLFKEKADLFLSLNGLYAGSDSVKQVLIIRNGSDGRTILKEKLSNNTFPGFLSERLKASFIEGLKIERSKCFILTPAATNAKSYSDTAIEVGAPYFIADYADASKEEWMLLLKSFSLFKKRQQSNWKLVLRLNERENDNLFKTSLKSYRYRDDVLLPDHFDEMVSGAYSLLDFKPETFEGFIVKAIDNGLPVICSTMSAAVEIAGKASIIIDELTPAVIADKIMLIYKDETLRAQLSKEALEQAKSFSFTKSAEILALQFKK